MTLPSDISVHLVTTIEEAAEMLKWVRDDPHNRQILAYDLETTGLDPREPGAAIRLAQIGDHMTAWAVPWDGWSGAFLQALRAWQGRLAAHNTSFDNLWLHIFTDWVPPYDRLDDTMLMAQICEPDKPSALKDIADRHIDRASSTGQQILKEAMKKQGWTWATIPVDFETYWVYGCIDTILTVYVWEFYRADLHYPAVYELEMNTRRVVSAMENNGIKIDLDYCREKRAAINAYVDEQKKWALDNWGFSITAPAQVADFFQNTLGQEITIFTDGGAPSANKDQMEIFLTSEDPLVSGAARYITDVKKADKTANTYFKNFLEFASADQKLHASFKTMGARTGRMSATRPALQTVSKGDPLLRNAFLPHDGHVLLSCDYSQIEMRLLCHFSEDQQLINTFKTADETGSDFFTELGKEIYGEPDFSKKDPRRTLVKSTLYGFIYGAGVNKMASTAGATVADMQKFINRLQATYPGIHEFQKKVTRIGDERERAEGQGYIITPSGRRLPSDKRRNHVLVNYTLQGTASEIMKEAVVNLDAAGLTEYLLLVIHDEVVASVPEDGYQEIAQTIQEIMTVRDRFAVDLLAECEGPFERWGEKYAV